ncbi:cysteine hydrolase [soil metagenome]
MSETLNSMAFSSPRDSDIALLIVDMINDFEFEGGKKLFKNTCSIVEGVRDLKFRARRANVPVIYVNDGLNRWSEDRDMFLETVLAGSAKAKEVVSEIRPMAGDYMIIKPQRSGFYGTSLGSLLLSLNVGRLIITGIATDICVLFTAHDAHMRGYSVSVPSDCAAAEADQFHRQALQLMERVAKIETAASDGISFGEPALPSVEVELAATIRSDRFVTRRHLVDKLPVY